MKSALDTLTATVADAEVLAHLRAHARDSGIADVRISIYTDSEGNEFCASAPNPASLNGARVHGFGPTIADAIARLRKQVPAPHESAAALRLEAARLAELAAKIEDTAL